MPSPKFHYRNTLTKCSNPEKLRTASSHMRFLVDYFKDDLEKVMGVGNVIAANEYLDVIDEVAATLDRKMDSQFDPDRCYHGKDCPADFAIFDKLTYESSVTPYIYARWTPECGLSQGVFERIAISNGFHHNEDTGLWFSSVYRSPKL